MKYKSLNHKAFSLDKTQLEQYLEKLASDQILQKISSKETYPIPKLKENFLAIEEVNHILNEHIKLKIPIHPAGEWILDNFYIIEEVVKTIKQNMTLKKYKQFIGISNGQDAGFARIYVLAYEIVNYTDNRIDQQNVSSLLSYYQKKKNLSMQEIWNIGIFMQIAIIQNIRNICDKIYFSQLQKYRAENIFERLVERKEELKYKNLGEYKKIKGYGEMKYPFIEYLSYKLKKQGKIATPFINALEEQVNKMGTTIDEIVKKEHFDIALKKVEMANCITSLKELLRMDFLTIFEQSNGIEEILKQDPANVYSKMELKTKEQYRNAIQKIAKKTKIAEIYIAKKALKLANEEAEKLKEKEKTLTKKSHIGYYLIDKGKNELHQVLQQKQTNKISTKSKAKLYVFVIWSISIILDIILIAMIQTKIKNMLISVILGIFLSLPIQEIIVQIIQYILGKIVKPKLIPKMDFSYGVPKEAATFVVIPTILKNKEKVAELMKKLEIYYLANKSENLYFALLGDCSASQNKKEPFDKEVIEEGLKQVKLLNQKYQDKSFPKFHFIYRKRQWNDKENCYLGWERKRGLLNQFNDYLLGKQENPFEVNTLTLSGFKIKYIITLDADTELVLNSALELIGAMEHILNKPVLNEKGNCVIDGHALIQPRVGITMEAANKNLFTKIFAGNGGLDCYTNAISDVYQDNFGEGIFTGKGIYNLEVFSKVLANEIPENTVLSHDLLEGSYLRCGLASDIMLVDGYPTSYTSSKLRAHRWIRGDFQISRWTKKYIKDKRENKKENPLNFLSKFKIVDNLIRAITPIFSMATIALLYIINIFYNYNIGILLSIALVSVTFPSILDIVNRIIYKKEGQKYQRTFEPKINSLFATILRGIFAIMELPDKAYTSLNAICKTIYRLNFSKKHLLEWVTSEEADKLAKTDIASYYKGMLPNVFLGVCGIVYGIIKEKTLINLVLLSISSLWLLAPMVFCYISKTSSKKAPINEINKQDKDYLIEIGKRTWQYFKDTLTKENNYLPPDNYQENRRPIFVNRTSSTNIGLALLCVISSYDMGYENLADTLKLLNNMVKTIEELQKWNGHLYNWYNIKTLEPLTPKYISTVDSGNFVGYVYVLKSFYQNVKKQIKEPELLELIPKWVDRPIDEVEMANADFGKLYDWRKNIFSIGYNIEDDKLTQSYYDLLASEARQASFIAISKKDVPVKHWRYLSRTLTEMNGYSGLISWSGTAFEYLMPNIIMKNEKGSLIDESCEFMLMEQKIYAKKLGVPWGFSETAFYLKDLIGNYQYKAIGIPWLGLKRGLEDDLVVASYASAMALNRHPKEVIQNLKKLDEQKMLQKYGFFESIDYTPLRMIKGKNQMLVKTYMAHHEALILLSINNLLNNNILQKRFSENPEIAAVEILLQEALPEKRIITKKDKIKPEKIVYEDYENYAQRIYKNLRSQLPICNVISSEKYSIVIDTKGNGYSKYKNYLINKYSPISDEKEGIFFYLKNIKNKQVWTVNDTDNEKVDKYEIIFTEASNTIKKEKCGISSKCKITISPENSVEIRSLELLNNLKEEQTLEITTKIEPALIELEQYASHPAFQNLFLEYEYLEEENIFIIKRKNRLNTKIGLYLAVSFYAEENLEIGELEYELDKEKFQGRGNFGIPTMVKNSKPFSRKIQYVIEPVLALRRTISIKPEQKTKLNLLLSASENREEAIKNIKEYTQEKKIDKAFELSIAKADAEARYLGLKAKQIETYQKMLGYLLFSNTVQSKEQFKEEKYAKEGLWKYGISGDLPILLVKIKDSNEAENLQEVIKAYEFFRLKNVEVDLVILNKEPNSYENYTKEAIENAILNANLGYMQNLSGGIFIIDNEEENLLEFYAKLVIETSKGPVERQLADLEEEYLASSRKIGEKMPKTYEIYKEEKNIKTSLLKEELLYENEYGGFSQNGKEYIILQDAKNRLPTVWSNVIANKHFGTLTTDSMGGFTFNQNSGLNKLTNWANNQVLDIPSEVIYLQDEETLKAWSLGLNPMPDDKQYRTTFGFGYAIYNHQSNNVDQEVTTFVAEKDSVKISLLNLKNLLPRKKKLNLIYYIKPVLGENALKTNRYINLNFKENNNMLIIENKANTEFNEIMYVSSNEKIKSYTGDRNLFFGNSDLSSPNALKKVMLNNQNSVGKEPIVAIQIEIELEAYETKKISILLGSENSTLDAQDKAYQYTRIERIETELENVKNKWRNTLEKVQVNTPLASFNILMNGWLIYQTLSCRLYARAGFYQAGRSFRL